MFDKNKGMKFKDCKIVIITLFCSILLIMISSKYSIYQVHSSSMENTLLPGDFILVKKVNFSKKSLSVCKLKRNSILLFRNNCIDSTKILIKRCLGLPGDKLQFCDNNEIFINDKKVNHIKSQKIEILVDYKGDNKLLNHCIERHIAISKCNSQQLSIIVTENDLNELQEFNFIDKFVYNSWPNLKKQGTSSLIIQMPKKGDKFISNQGFDFGCYYTTDKRSGHSISFNYFFMIGDNRYSSVDSRTYGLVPESIITGQAIMILFSLERVKPGLKKIRGNRLFIPINLLD